jgi:hypothetical protein
MRLVTYEEAMNERIALWTTRIVGTMWCAYAFLALALLPLFWPASESTVQYASSSVLQLVLLPIILVGQALEGRAAEKRAAEDHAALMEILKRMETDSVCHVKKNPAG